MRRTPSTGSASNCCASEPPEDDDPLRIRVSYDKDAGTITIADNGIGMSREEVIEHIGTIAKSGTREFLRALTGDQRKDATLIGQFGVGLLLAFIVAERVTLTTRRHGLSGRGGRPLGVGRQGRVHAGDDRAAGPGHHDRAPAPGERGRPAQRVPAALDHPEVLRPHQRADPDAARKGKGRLEADDRTPVNQASALWARPKASSPTRTTGTSTGTSPPTSPTRSPGCTASRRDLRVHAAAVHPGPRAFRPLDHRRPAGV